MSGTNGSSKKPYASPRLTKLGPMALLTQSGSSTGRESSGTGNQNKRSG